MATAREIEGLLDKIIARYSPGGEFGKPEEALLKRAKVKSLAETSQDLVSSGLSGTNVGGGAGKSWEEEVGMPARLKLEDIRSQRLTEAMGAKAGYLERRSASDVTGNLELMRQQQKQRMFDYERQQNLADRNRANREESRQRLQDRMGSGGYGGRSSDGGGAGSIYGSSYGGGQTGTTGPYGIGTLESSGYAPEMGTGFSERGEGAFVGAARSVAGGAAVGGSASYIPTTNYEAELFKKTGESFYGQPGDGNRKAYARLREIG